MIYVVAIVPTIVDKKHVDAIKNGWSLGQSIIHMRVHSYFSLSCYNVVSTGIAIIEIMIQVHIHIVSREGINFGKDTFFKNIVFYHVCPRQFVHYCLNTYCDQFSCKKNLHLFYVNTAYY